MATKYNIFFHYSAELKKLIDEVDTYRKNNEYFYKKAMDQYARRYNALLLKYFDTTKISIETFNIYDYELSASKKTVKNEVVDRFKINILSTKTLVDRRIAEERNKEIAKTIPFHQMRRCLKTDVEGCPKNPPLRNNKVFVGMPFDKRYFDSYKYGIKIALDAYGLECFRADDVISNMDVMCKICEQMQIAKYLIFNISGLNPNVMLELGLSYGLGKETIIVKDEDTQIIADIANIEYINYPHAGELQEKLIKYISTALF